MDRSVSTTSTARRALAVAAAAVGDFVVGRSRRGHVRTGWFAVVTAHDRRPATGGMRWLSLARRKYSSGPGRDRQTSRDGEKSPVWSLAPVRKCRICRAQQGLQLQASIDDVPSWASSSRLASRLAGVRRSLSDAAFASGIQLALGGNPRAAMHGAYRR
jgi:hypothetical protein